MKTFDLPSNSNYGDQPIPIAFPDNWDVHISKIHGYDNCTEIDEIATEMRLVLPREIQQAQNIVADKNRIISDAKKEAEAIISKAEQQRRELIDQNSILQEARRRATEEISAAQQRSNLIRSSTQDYTDKMLSRVEELMVKDVNELRILRKTLSTGTELAKPQQPAQLPQGQPVPQKK